MLLGQFAAVGAAVAFSITSTSFTLAGRSFGPRLVMTFSLPAALILLATFHWITQGQIFPVDAESWRYAWLGVSGIIGFWLGSVALVNAFVLIGPRLALLIGSISPILSILLAWLFLDESLKAVVFIGVIITVSGIVWVVSDPTGNNKSSTVDIHSPEFRRGIVFAVLGACGQAISLVLSKHGLEDDFNPISGTLIRLGIAVIAIWTFTIITGQARSSVITVRSNPVAFRFLMLGAVCGPVAGASLVMVALQNAPVGIANTLINLTPIILIPISYFVFSEQVTKRAVTGTLVAIMGTAILFLV